jgi:hypothetical protein
MFGDIFLAFRVGGVAAFGGSKGGTPCWGIWADRAEPYLRVLRPLRVGGRPRPGSRRHEGGAGRLPPDEEATRGSHRRPMGQAARQQLNTAESPNWRPKNPFYREQPIHLK